MYARDYYRPLSGNGFEIPDDAREILRWKSTPNVLIKRMGFIRNHKRGFLSESDLISFQGKIEKACDVNGKNLLLPFALQSMANTTALTLR